MPQDAGTPAPAANGADAPARPLHGGGTCRGVWHPQPHGLRTPAAHAALWPAQEREGRAQGLLQDHRAAPGKHHGLRRGTIWWRMIFFRHKYRNIGILPAMNANSKLTNTGGKMMEFLIPLGVLAVWIILQA